MKQSLIGLSLLAGIANFGQAFAAETVQPYIDDLKQNMKDHDQPTEQPALDPNATYLNSIKKKLEPESKESYIDQLKENDPEKYRQSDDSKSFIDATKATLEPKEEGGAIRATLEGRSDLEMKRTGPISGAYGFRYGAGLVQNVNVVNSPGGASFASIYGKNYSPDIALFYEYQPFHSEWFGNFGIVATAEFAYYWGFGNFQYAIPNPFNPGTNFSTQSNTFFQFFNVPISAGIDYRFNLFRILRPFVQGMATVIGYQEHRNDGGPQFQGFSTAFTLTGGVSLLLDWMSKSAAWNLYTEFGIKHYYLTAEFEDMIPFGPNDVNIGVTGVMLGFTFEF